MTGDTMSRGLSDMWRSVLLFVPAALAFAAILLIGYLVARLLRAAVGRGLQRAGFDRAASRGALGRTLSGAGLQASDLCARLVFYGILLVALQLAFGIWGPNPVSDLLSALIAWLPRLLVAIIIVVIAVAVATKVHDLTAAALAALPYGRMLARIASVTIVALGVIAALDQVSIAASVTGPLYIAVLAAVVGVVIVGVGGGLVRPMQHRWEGWLDRAGAESTVIREHAQAYTREREEARRAEEARVAAETRRAEEAERTRRAAEAEEARRAEEGRRAEAARAEEARVEEARARAAEVSRTQTLPDATVPLPGSAGSAERTAPLPGGGGPAERTAALPDTTVALPGGAGSAEETQVIPPLPPQQREPEGETGGETGAGEADRTQVIPPVTGTERPGRTERPE